MGPRDPYDRKVESPHLLLRVFEAISNPVGYARNTPGSICQYKEDGLVSRPLSLFTSMRRPMHGTSCPKSQLKSTCLTAKFGSFLDHAETGEKGQNVISSSVQHSISLIFAIHVSFIIPLVTNDVGPIVSLTVRYSPSSEVQTRSFTWAATNELNLSPIFLLKILKIRPKKINSLSQLPLVKKLCALLFFFFFFFFTKISYALCDFFFFFLIELAL